MLSVYNEEEGIRIMDSLDAEPMEEDFDDTIVIDFNVLAKGPNVPSRITINNLSPFNPLESSMDKQDAEAASQKDAGNDDCNNETMSSKSNATARISLNLSTVGENVINNTNCTSPDAQLDDIDLGTEDLPKEDIDDLLEDELLREPEENGEKVGNGEQIEEEANADIIQESVTSMGMEVVSDVKDPVEGAKTIEKHMGESCNNIVSAAPVLGSEKCTNSESTSNFMFGNNHANEIESISDDAFIEDSKYTCNGIDNKKEVNSAKEVLEDFKDSTTTANNTGVTTFVDAVQGKAIEADLYDVHNEFAEDSKSTCNGIDYKAEKLDTEIDNSSNDFIGSFVTTSSSDRVTNSEAVEENGVSNASDENLSDAFVELSQNICNGTGDTAKLIIETDVVSEDLKESDTARVANKNVLDENEISITVKDDARVSIGIDLACINENGAELGEKNTGYEDSKSSFIDAKASNKETNLDIVSSDVLQATVEETFNENHDELSYSDNIEEELRIMHGIASEDVEESNIKQSAMNVDGVIEEDQKTDSSGMDWDAVEKSMSEISYASSASKDILNCVQINGDSKEYETCRPNHSAGNEVGSSCEDMDSTSLLGERIDGSITGNAVSASAADTVLNKPPIDVNILPVKNGINEVLMFDEVSDTELDEAEPVEDSKAVCSEILEELLCKAVGQVPNEVVTDEGNVVSQLPEVDSAKVVKKDPLDLELSADLNVESTSGNIAEPLTLIDESDVKSHNTEFMEVDQKTINNCDLTVSADEHTQVSNVLQGECVENSVGNEGKLENIDLAIDPTLDDSVNNCSSTVSEFIDDLVLKIVEDVMDNVDKEDDNFGIVNIMLMENQVAWNNFMTSNIVKSLVQEIVDIAVDRAEEKEESTADFYLMDDFDSLDSNFEDQFNMGDATMSEIDEPAASEHSAEVDNDNFVEERAEGGNESTAMIVMPLVLEIIEMAMNKVDAEEEAYLDKTLVDKSLDVTLEEPVSSDNFDSSDIVKSLVFDLVEKVMEDSDEKKTAMDYSDEFASVLDKPAPTDSALSSQASSVPNSAETLDAPALTTSEIVNGFVLEMVERAMNMVDEENACVVPLEKDFDFAEPLKENDMQTVETNEQNLLADEAEGNFADDLNLDDELADRKVTEGKTNDLTDEEERRLLEGDDNIDEDLINEELLLEEPSDSTSKEIDQLEVSEAISDDTISVVKYVLNDLFDRSVGITQESAECLQREPKSAIEKTDLKRKRVHSGGDVKRWKTSRPAVETPAEIVSGILEEIIDRVLPREHSPEGQISQRSPDDFEGLTDDDSFDAGGPELFDDDDDILLENEEVEEEIEPKDFVLKILDEIITNVVKHSDKEVIIYDIMEDIFKESTKTDFMGVIAAATTIDSKDFFRLPAIADNFYATAGKDIDLLATIKTEVFDPMVAVKQEPYDDFYPLMGLDDIKPMVRLDDCTRGRNRGGSAGRKRGNSRAKKKKSPARPAPKRKRPEPKPKPVKQSRPVVDEPYQPSKRSRRAPAPKSPAKPSLSLRSREKSPPIVPIVTASKRRVVLPAILRRSREHRSPPSSSLSLAARAGDRKRDSPAATGRVIAAVPVPVGSLFPTRVPKPKPPVVLPLSKSRRTMPPAIPIPHIPPRKPMIRTAQINDPRIAAKGSPFVKLSSRPVPPPPKAPDPRKRTSLPAPSGRFSQLLTPEPPATTARKRTARVPSPPAPKRGRNSFSPTRPSTRYSSSPSTRFSSSPSPPPPSRHSNRYSPVPEPEKRPMRSGFLPEPKRKNIALKSTTVQAVKIQQVAKKRTMPSVNITKPVPSTSQDRSFNFEDLLKRKRIPQRFPSMSEPSPKRPAQDGTSNMASCRVNLERNPMIERLLPSRKKSANEPNICELCEPVRVFTSKQGLVKHLKEEHTTALPQAPVAITDRCAGCDRKYFSSKRLLEHMRTCPAVAALPSTSKLPAADALQQRLAGEETRLGCSYCEKIFLTKSALNTHVLVSHSSEDDPLGSESLDDDIQEDAHFSSEIMRRSDKVVMRLRREESSFRCTKCSAIFLKKKDYEDHQLLHDKAYKCRTCPAVFDSKAHLIGHELSHTVQIKIKQERMSPEIEIIEERLAAPLPIFVSQPITPSLPVAVAKKSTGGKPAKKQSVAKKSTGTRPSEVVRSSFPPILSAPRPMRKKL